MFSSGTPFLSTLLSVTAYKTYALCLVFLGVCFASPSVKAQGPTVSAPATNSTGSYSINWFAVGGSLQERVGNGSWGPAQGTTQTTSGVYHVTQVTRGNGTYHYRVYSCYYDNVNGMYQMVCGYSSTATTVVSVPKPPAPASITVSPLHPHRAFYISWPKENEATKYQVEREVGGSGNWTEIYDNSGLITYESNVIPEQQYRFRVRSYHPISGYTTTPTTSGIFKVNFMVPSITGPSSSDTGSYVLNWGVISGASHYDLAWEGPQDTPGTWPNTQASSSTSFEANVTTSGVYRYRVRACNNLAMCGQYSSPKSVTVTLPPNEPSPLPAGQTEAINDPPPSAPESSTVVGYTNGAFNVNEMGAATYSVPLVLPKGSGGATPQLSLDYSSQGGNGILGKGWALSGLSAVSRCRQTLAQDGQARPISWTVSDRFCLDGQRLILSSGSYYGAPNAVYKTEVDSFVKVVSHGGQAGAPNYFVVYGKDGSKKTYGGKTNSKVTSNGKVLSWFVSTIEDNYGNNIEFEYEGSALTGYRIKHVRYAYGSGSAAGAAVDFNYQSGVREDITDTYIAGEQFRTTKLLQSIVVRNGAQIARRYEFSYLSNSGDEFSRLESIKECFPNSSNCYRPLEFAWGDNSYQFSSTNEIVSSAGNLGTVIDFKQADTTGDGKREMIVVRYLPEPSQGSPFGGRATVQIVSNNGENSYYLSLGYFNSSASVKVETIDYNMDARSDLIIYQPSVNSWQVYLSKPQENGTWRISGGGSIPTSVTGRNVTFVDITSNGLVDAVMHNGYRSLTRNAQEPATSNTAYHFGSFVSLQWDSSDSFGTGVPPSGNCSIHEVTDHLMRTSLADFNGNGRAGLIGYRARNYRCIIHPYGPNDYVNYSHRSYHALEIENNVLKNYGAIPNPTALNIQDEKYAMDINGDGLADIVYRSTANTYHYVINTGAGFTAPQLYATIPAGEKAQFIDYSGNGYVDVVWRDPATKVLYIKKWAGKYFDNPNSSEQTSFLVNAVFDDVNHLIMDVDGDGLYDFIRIFPESVHLRRGVYSSSNQPVDAIVKIDNGGSNELSIDYGTLSNSGHYVTLDINPDINHVDIGFIELCYSHYNACVSYEHSYTYAVVDASSFYQRINSGWDYDNVYEVDRPPVIEVNGPMYVVTSTERRAPAATSQPGNVDYNAVNKQRYYYAEAKVQTSGRGFLGFSRIKVVDEQSGIATTTGYRLDFPYAGLPLYTAVMSADGADGKQLTLARNAWNHKAFSAPDGTKRYQLYIEKSMEQEFALENNGQTQGDLLRTVTTQSEYDDYGNAVDITITTESGSEVHTKVLVNTYGGPSDTWMKEMGRLTETVVTVSQPGYAPSVRESRFTYYGSGDSDGARGMLKTEIVDPDNVALRLTTTYKYDDFGNVRSKAISGNGVQTRESTWVYDDSGRFVDIQTNAMGHDVLRVIERDSWLRPKAVNDVHGNTTYISYTADGREYLSKQTRPNGDGPWTYKDLSYCAGSVACPQGAVTRATYRKAGGSRSFEYFDGLGRTIRKTTVGFGGQHIHVDIEYDELGRERRRSNPYFNGAAISGWTEYSYDLLGRVIELKLPNGNIGESINYQGYTTTYTNAKNQEKIEIRNMLGQVTQVTDNLGGTIAYEYDLAGNLLSTTTNSDGTAVKVRMCYDGRGRKVAMHDPDKGGFRRNSGATCAAVAADPSLAGWWHYQYDVLDQLTYQRDPKGQVRTMEYDKLGRMLRRTDRRTNNAIEQHTRWYYDTGVGGEIQTGAIGQITGVVMSNSANDENCNSNNYCATYHYDAYGNAAGQMLLLPTVDDVYVSQTFRDSLGRPFQERDVLNGLVMTNSGTRSHYNQYGYLSRITDLASGDVLHQILETNARGQVVRESRNNGAAGTTEYAYDDALGHMKGQVASVAGVLFPIQDVSYEWDDLHNLQSRHNESVNGPGSATKNLRESFCYDGLNRLIRAHQGTLNGGCNLTPSQQDFRYDGRGNITYKQGVGNYSYGYYGATNPQHGPHAVTSAGSTQYHYDNNGNVTSDSGGRQLQYTTYDKPNLITQGSGLSTAFDYGPGRDRYRRVDTVGITTTTTHYLGNVERIQQQGSNQITWKRYVAGAIYTVTTNASHVVQGAVQKRFVYKDHLGSVDVITDANGAVQQAQSFDVWGQRRHAENWAALTGSQLTNFDTTITRRGYTGHEHLDRLGLIHMNGRVYDPKLGRFLQADPFIQSPGNTQSYNRYSYVINNPLNLTDPSGYIWGHVAWAVGSYLVGRHAAKNNLPWLAMAAQIVGCANGFCPAASLGGTYGSTGNPMLAMMAAFAAGTLGHMDLHAGAQFAANGMIGGMGSAMMGGRFEHGFAAGAIGTFGAGDGMSGLVQSVIVGGTVSHVTGGKFKNGAATAAFSWAIQQGAKGFSENNKVGYRSEESAARAALKKYNPLSIENDLEYGGKIYKTGDRYFYSDAVVGGKDWVFPQEAIVPNDDLVTAFYHTHGAAGQEYFSDAPIIVTRIPTEGGKAVLESIGYTGDKPLARSEGVNFYLATPKNAFKVFIPSLERATGNGVIELGGLYD